MLVRPPDLAREDVGGVAVDRGAVGAPIDGPVDGAAAGASSSPT
jgi:hypothetical protein